MIERIVDARVAKILADARPANDETPKGPAAEYLDDIALAEWLAISRETLQALRRGTDGPPFVRVARRAVRYHVPAVREWLARRVAK